MQVPSEHLKPALGNLYQYLNTIGDYVSSQVVQGSAVSLTSTTAANVTSITLNAGEWDVSGVVGFIPAASTSITAISASSSHTSGTVGGTAHNNSFTQAAVVPGAVAQTYPIPTARVLVPAGTTQVLYLVARATFTVSTLGAFGIIQARRVA